MARGCTSPGSRNLLWGGAVLPEGRQNAWGGGGGVQSAYGQFENWGGGGGGGELNELIHITRIST